MSLELIKSAKAISIHINTTVAEWNKRADFFLCCFKYRGYEVVCSAFHSIFILAQREKGGIFI
jgi:hypothetical protein